MDTLSKGSTMNKHYIYSEFWLLIAKFWLGVGQCSSSITGFATSRCAKATHRVETNIAKQRIEAMMKGEKNVGS